MRDNLLFDLALVWLFLPAVVMRKEWDEDLCLYSGNTERKMNDANVFLDSFSQLDIGIKVLNEIKKNRRFRSKLKDSFFVHRCNEVGM